MIYGKIPGLNKKVSKLIMGNDNQTDYEIASKVWDHWIGVGGNAFDNAHIYGGGSMETLFGKWHKSRNNLNDIEIPKSMGVIVRTAGANKTKNEIEKDFQNTISTWDQIKNKAVESNAPALNYEEGDIIKSALRDIYDNNTSSIYIDGNEGYQKAKIFIKELIPKSAKFLKGAGVKL